MRVVFVIDKLEFRHFELNELVTSFWLIKEYLLRGYEVFITTTDRLFLNGNKPFAYLHKTSLLNNKSKQDMLYEKQAVSECLNNFSLIMFRPDPPVNIEYIFSTYIMDYVDSTKTTVINSPKGIRNANEKLYINNFPDIIPKGITTSNSSMIKEFVHENDEAVIKPLNRCFGKGVYYLKKGDKNLNTIIDSATNSGENPVMVQEYLKNAYNRDKRIIIIGGEVYEECLIKLSGKEDFKFNTHRDEFFIKSCLTEEERHIAKTVAPKLLEDGLFLAGLDVMDEKLIEVNVTSPCFFIKEINSLFGVEIEKRIVDYILSLCFCRAK